MGTIRIRPEAELRDRVAAAYAEHGARIAGRLPAAEVEHVGSTSIPGALTKGDLDLLVRVPPSAFGAAERVLGEMYAVHQPENWTPTYASFADPEADDPPVGVQLVVGGSADDDLFGPFRRAMTGDPELLAAYNDLKRRYDGSDYDTYTDAKGAFIERVMRGYEGGVDLARAGRVREARPTPIREARLMSGTQVTTTPDLDALLAAFNAHDTDAVMEFFTDDCVMEMPRGPAPGGRRLVGRDQVRQGIQSRFDGIPDIEYGDARHFTCGDRGVSEWTIRGTQLSGEPIEVRGCDLFEFTEGLISRKDAFWKIVG